VTLNYEKFTWHPHLHCLCFVPKEYFSKDNKNYISQAELTEYWGKACKLDYKPIVDIRRVYDKSSQKERISFDDNKKGSSISLSGAIFETAKYCVKPLKIFSETLDDYEDASEENGRFEKKRNSVNLNISKHLVKELVRELSESLANRRLRASGGRIKDIERELKLDVDESQKDLLHSDDGTKMTEMVRKEIYEYVFEDKEYYLTMQGEFEGESNERDLECNEINFDNDCGSSEDKLFEDEDCNIDGGFQFWQTEFGEVIIFQTACWEYPQAP
jgi:plasmid rolling circle replication initiator protein Rep